MNLTAMLVDDEPADSGESELHFTLGRDGD